MSSCEERTRPWEGQSGPAPVLSTPLPAASPGAPSAADPAPASSPGAAPSDPELPALPVRVGGPWVRCYGNFRLSGEPLKDVTRLSLLCGPSNGMRRLSKAPFEGRVAEAQPPATHAFPAELGACYRVFAAAGPGVADLDVVIRSSRGAAIASDGAEDPWPIVQSDRPFCALEDDTLTVEISAHRGAGAFAAEVWVLRSKREGG